MARKAVKETTSVDVLNEPPPRDEWRFDDVPEGELQACLLYEYERELILAVLDLKLRNGVSASDLSRTERPKWWDIVDARKEQTNQKRRYFPKTSWQNYSKTERQKLVIRARFRSRIITNPRRDALDVHGLCDRQPALKKPF